MDLNPSAEHGSLQGAEVLSLGPYEKRFRGAAFLAQLSSAFALLSLFLLPLLLVTLSTSVFTPSSSSMLTRFASPFLLALPFAFFALWSCAIAYMWRAVIFFSVLLLFLLLVGTALAISAAQIDKTITELFPYNELALNEYRRSFAAVAVFLARAMIPVLFAFAILFDGCRLAWTKSEDRALYATIDPRRGVLQLLAAIAGIPPICRWLPPARRVLAGAFFALAAIVIGVVVAATVIVLLTADPLAAIVTAFTGGGVVPVLIIVLFRFLARRVARVSAETLARTDNRPPVLFLRSFKDDQVDLDRPKRGFFRGYVGIAAASPTLDHVLLEEFTALGPVVAIGMPRAPAPFGAARTYASDAEWQTVVAKFANEAAAIVIVVDDTEGVKWELSHILESGHLTKTLCLMPPRLVRRMENAADIVRRALLDQKSTLMRPLIEPCIGWYSLPQGGTALLTAPRPTQTNYICALRLFRKNVRHMLTPAIA